MMTGTRRRDDSHLNVPKAAKLHERLGLLTAPLWQATAALRQAKAARKERRQRMRLRNTWRGD